MVWLQLAVVLVVCGITVTVISAAMVAWGLTHPPRMTDGKALAILRRLSPEDLDLPFEFVRFDIPDAAAKPPNSDRIAVAGWWIPAVLPSDRCVVLLHGYADAKVGSIAWAPILHRLGWHVLAIDLRAHGESGGTRVTGGHFERHDVSAVLNELRLTRPAETTSIVLFGISMGSAIAVLTAAARPDIAGVIAESFVGDFVFASRSQMKLVGSPGGLVAWLSAHIAAWVTGADLHRGTALAALPKVKCPVLLIVGESDPFTDADAVRKSTQALSNVTVWQPAGVDHLRAMSHAYDDYVRQIEGFLATVEIIKASEVRPSSSFGVPKDDEGR